MKAVVIHRYGPPDVLQYEDVPDPQPRDGEIRVRVHAATVNRGSMSAAPGKRANEGIVLPIILGSIAPARRCGGPHVTRWRRATRRSRRVMRRSVCAGRRRYDGPTGMRGIKRPRLCRAGGGSRLRDGGAARRSRLPRRVGDHAARAHRLDVAATAKLRSRETVLSWGGGNLGSVAFRSPAT